MNTNTCYNVNCITSLRQTQAFTHTITEAWIHTYNTTIYINKAVSASPRKLKSSEFNELIRR